LGNVIKALINPNSKHIPFRDSKLTRLLQDSLGGNTKTMMVANLGPSILNFEETISTLRYADRAKQIKNAPRINEDPKDTMLRTMQDEIAKLKAALDAKKRGFTSVPGGPGGPGGPDGVTMTAADGTQTIVETKIVERKVVVNTGLTEEDLKKLQEKVKQEVEAMKDKTETEKQKITQDRLVAEQEAKIKEQELLAKQQLLDRERKELESIQKKIEEKQKQLLAGGAQLGEAAKQKLELKRTEEELRLRREHEERLKAQLAREEDERLLLAEKYDSTEQELQKTTEKLKLLFQKYQDKKEELKDLQEEFEIEREELVNTLRDLDRTLKLKNHMLHSFIPPNYVDLIEKSASWSQFNDEWIIPGIEYAGNNVQRQVNGYAHRRAIAEFDSPSMTPHHIDIDEMHRLASTGDARAIAALQRLSQMAAGSSAAAAAAGTAESGSSPPRQSVYFSYGELAADRKTTTPQPTAGAATTTASTRRGRYNVN